MTEREESPAAWGELPTEARHPASAELDALPTTDIVELLLEEDRRGLDRALAQREAIAAAAERLAATIAGGGRIFLAGAGTSGRLGVLEAAECPPTFGTDPELVQGLIAGGAEAVFRAREGSEDDAAAGRAAMKELGAEDLLIGLSASSVTPFVRGALRAARDHGGGTILLTCASAEGLEDAADQVLALDTGAEILTGSTRLKAGSATKAVLNALTTAAMVRLGKTYGNLMVDLRPGSAKLRDRARRIVAAAGDVSLERAGELYAVAGGEVKTAIVMARAEVEVDEARRRLQEVNGHVRRALALP